MAMGEILPKLTYSFQNNSQEWFSTDAWEIVHIFNSRQLERNARRVQFLPSQGSSTSTQNR